MVIPTILPPVTTTADTTWKFPEAPPDPILTLNTLYRSDPRPHAINLSVGAYRDANGAPHEFRAVRKARQLISKDDRLSNHQYLPISGSSKFNNLTSRLIFGAELAKQPYITTVQTISGTGSLRVALDFCKRVLNCSTLYIPTPTWGNHLQLSTDSNLKSSHYRYYCASTHSLDAPGLLSDLWNADHRTVVLFQACGHNPSGIDPSLNTWQRMLDIVKNRRCVVLFDMAYQGLSSGNLEDDAKVVRLFARSVPTLVCQSYAKCMGLYNSRIGSLSVCTPEYPNIGTRVQSQLKWIIRSMYSSPPVYGAHVVEAILSSDALRKEWVGEVSEMVDRIDMMRAMLYHGLVKRRVAGSWEHVRASRGMFCLLGLNKVDVQVLRDEYGVYMTKDSRINVAGLTEKNVGALVEALAKVVGRRAVET